MQVDLFAGDAPIAPPRQVASAPAAPARLPLPVRVPAWESLLQRSAVAGDVTLHCCMASAGVVIDVLSCPDLGRKYLDRDGAIAELPPDSVHGRTVYVSVEQLRGWHRTHELVQVGPAGTASVRYRFGAPHACTKPLVFPFPFNEHARA